MKETDCAAEIRGNGKIAGLYNGVWSQYLVYSSEKYRPFFDIVYMGDLPACDLTQYAALYIPFQSNMDGLAERREQIEEYLEAGGTVIVEGNCDERLFPFARWEHRHLDQDWWMTDKSNYPCTVENPEHPVFRNLSMYHANWHNHGVYTVVPDTAEVLQRSREGEAVTWVDERRYKGRIFATTQDALVEMGIGQIRHLDEFVDAVVEWATGRKPQGRYTLPEWEAAA